METLIVTGGAGFIGCNFVRYALKNTDWKILVADKLTYAGNRLNLQDVEGDPRFKFIQMDIVDPQAVSSLYQEKDLAGVVHFAAETHVDRSIDSPRPFIDTNVAGTLEMLEGARRHQEGVTSSRRDAFRFLHVSTDEVYGSLGPKGAFSVETPYAPNSPYAASKAGADHLVRAYRETYGLPVLLTNCSNNYGPYQFPEKLIPLMILNAIEGKPLPVYGDGGNVRDWLHVEDHCEALMMVLKKGRPGEKYNVGVRNERNNLQVVDAICASLEEVHPVARNTALKDPTVKDYSSLKVFVKDRPGHDRRYAIDPSKIEREIGWKARYSFEEGLKETIQWYLRNLHWCRSVQEGQYGRERLGLGGRPNGKGARS